MLKACPTSAAHPAEQLDCRQCQLRVATLQVPQLVHQRDRGLGGNCSVPRRLHKAEHEHHPNPGLELARAPRAVLQRANNPLKDPTGSASLGTELQQSDASDSGLDQRSGIDPHLDAGVEKEAGEVATRSALEATTVHSSSVSWSIARWLSDSCANSEDSDRDWRRGCRGGGVGVEGGDEGAVLIGIAGEGVEEAECREVGNGGRGRG